MSFDTFVTAVKDDFSAFESKVKAIALVAEEDLAPLCKLVEELAPWVEKLSFLAGGNSAAVAAGALAADNIATAVSNAIAAHLAAGQTAQSGVEAVSAIVNAVIAQPGLVAAETAQTLNTVVAQFETAFVSENH